MRGVSPRNFSRKQPAPDWRDCAFVLIRRSASSTRPLIMLLAQSRWRLVMSPQTNNSPFPNIQGPRATMCAACSAPKKPRVSRTDRTSQRPTGALAPSDGSEGDPMDSPPTKKHETKHKNNISGALLLCELDSQRPTTAHWIGRRWWDLAATPKSSNPSEHSFDRKQHRTRRVKSEHCANRALSLS